MCIRDSIEALQGRGVEILSLRGEEAFLNSITATAEHAWGLLLAVVRQLRKAGRLASSGVWARDECRGMQLSGKTLGIVGYGRLGRMVAEYGRAFRMRVLVRERRNCTYPAWVKPVSLADLLSTADVVSVHVHLTPENAGLLGWSEFAQMKRGAVLINTSRGAIVDEAALLTALQSGRLAGAGLDVIHGEWSAQLAMHPLIQYSRNHECLVITPHIGGVTLESQRASYTFIIEKLRRFLCELEALR